jgi:hydrogenase expression/formation protein HypC
MCLAIPGRVVEAANVGVSRIAKVQFGGITRQIYLDFVPEAVPGDYILAHVGFAFSIIDQAEAERTYALLEEMGALAGEDEAGR